MYNNLIFTCVGLDPASKTLLLIMTEKKHIFTLVYSRLQMHWDFGSQLKVLLCWASNCLEEDKNRSISEGGVFTCLGFVTNLEEKKNIYKK